MSIPLTHRAIQVLEDFRDTCRSHGLSESSRAPVISRHDPSIRFTNSTISVLKPALEALPVPRTYLLQPALRLRNLDHFDRTGTVSPYGCSFHAFGALLPAADLEEAFALASDFLARTLLRGPGAEGRAEPLDLVARAHPGDGDLVTAATGAGWALDLDDPRLAPFRHVFGLPGTTGRNVNVAIRSSRGPVDVGNVIVIERDARPVAVEVAFGVNMVLLARDGIAHPILTTPAADADHCSRDLMARDALMASAVLAIEGLRPIARGRGGRYRQLLTLLVERHGGTAAEVTADLRATITRELEVRRASSPLGVGFSELGELEAVAAATAHVERLTAMTASLG